jgi:hypothetical protein
LIEDMHGERGNSGERVLSSVPLLGSSRPGMIGMRRE